MALLHVLSVRLVWSMIVCLCRYPFPDTEEVPCVFEIVKDGQVVWESPELNAAGQELGAFKVHA